MRSSLGYREFFLCIPPALEGISEAIENQERYKQVWTEGGRGSGRAALSQALWRVFFLHV